MEARHLFTSESVTEGHPDKVADRVSDSVLDAILDRDPNGRVACESMVTTGLAMVAGEITTQVYVDIPRIVREAIRDIGYTSSDYGFDCDTCAVLTSIDEQTGDIAMGVDTGGAGDQGLMFGFACRETEELMPLPITLAHRLTRRLSEVRRSGALPWMRPDGKSQVTIEYDGLTPVRVDTVVISTQHDPDVADLRGQVIAEVIDPVLAGVDIEHADPTIHVNPTGRFVIGGPQGDCGLTGRKIIVDTYGGTAPHGGGAFSGKDPSKVDRSASYAARWVAKTVVAAGLAERCLVQLAYAIGVADPVSVAVQTYGTGEMADAAITQAVNEVFDLTPKGIIESLDLRRPIYRATSAFGHFGRPDQDFPWERLDRVEALKSAAG